MKNTYKKIAIVVIVWTPIIVMVVGIFWLWNQDKHKSSEEKYHLVTDNRGNYRIATKDYVSPINRTDLKQACEALRRMNDSDFPYKDESLTLWLPVECDLAHGKGE